jgi:hypothetical protein
VLSAGIPVVAGLIPEAAHPPLTSIGSFWYD